MNDERQRRETVAEYEGADGTDAPADPDPSIGSIARSAWPIWGSGWSPTWPWSPGGDGDGRVSEDAGVEDRRERVTVGPPALVAVVGLALVLVPEPVTSAVGLVLLLAGAAGLVAEAVRASDRES